MKYLLIFLASLSQLLGDATDYTKKSNEKVLTELPFAEKQDFKFAQKGFLAPLQNEGVIKDENGNIVWDLPQYNFAKGVSAPSTVNPSLWRQLQLLLNAGLYKVCDRLYQVRSADLANMTIVEGQTGLIIIDTLMSIETAAAALELYYLHRPKAPIRAVIFSHSHIDHFGGIKGIVSEEDVKLGKVKIYAPKGFVEEALSENIMAGNVMSRRASYMYGSLIPKGPMGQTSAGLGLTTSNGTVSFLLPTDIINFPEERKTIDGLTFEFMLAPETEAPSEMHFYIPELKALSAAENAVHNMHNLYTLRGAKIRNAKAWAEYLNKTRYKWGREVEVFYGMHQWPIWGNGAINKHLILTADAYKYMHDQTLHMANLGFKRDEIAEYLKLPKVMQDYWPLQQYYGNLNQNIKSIYVYYLGWFDGNPANLHPLPPSESSKKYVAFMGGADSLLDKAQSSYDQGEYRWVAEVVNHLVFADPSNQKARDLQAAALRQLGYQTETGPWRDFYLSGAQELERGIEKNEAPSTSNADIVAAMPINMLFDYMAIELNGPAAQDTQITLNWNFPDIKKHYVLFLRNGVLNYRENEQDGNADATITLSRPLLTELLLHKVDIPMSEKEGAIKIKGNPAKIKELFSLFEPFNFWFPLVTP